MSKCIITVKVNGEELKLNLNDSSPSVLIDESFIQALREDPEALNKIVEGIRAQSINSGLRSIKLKDLQQEGIQANCTLQYLRESPEFGEIQFPDGNANILLVNKLSIGGKPIYGRTINSNGEEVFIVKGTKEDVQKLSNFLKIRNTIRDYGLNISEESPYYQELNEILQESKQKNQEIGSLEDMLVDYVSNKKAYSGIFLKSGKSAIQVAESFLRNLRNYDIPNDYEDPFVTDLNFRKFYKGDGEIFISNQDLYKMLKQYHKPLLDSIGVSTQKAFNEFGSRKADEVINSILDYVNSQEGNVDDVKQLLDGAKNSYDALLRLVLSSEPDFTYQYAYSSKKGITLKQQFTPISEKYGIAYDTIQNMSTETYRGYTIYAEVLPNKKKRYYLSRGTLVEQSLSNSYTSKKAAQAAVDKALSRQHLRKNSLIEFKFRDHSTNEDGSSNWDNSLPSEFVRSSTNFLPGQIVESINVPVDRNTNIRGDEQFLLGKNAYTLQSFNKLVQSWNIDETSKDRIISEMNTPEKAVTYIYKINELLGMEDRTNAQELVNIANDIAESDSNYYYIEDRKSLGSNGWEYKVIPTDKDQIEEYKKKQNAPITTWMSAISTALQNQFGVPINLVTSEEVSEELKGIADPNIDKAFIYNGEVYVNTSIASTNDLLHEHVHLVLGMLKSNPELRGNYERLLNLVLSTDEGRFTMNKLRDRYSELSQMDLAEEVFAKLFSNYVRRHTSLQTDQVFSASEEQLKKLTKSVFNTNIVDVKEFYGKSITSIFGKFNKEVAQMLQSPDIDFGSTKNSRKISAWISKQVADGNIIEKC